MCRPTNKNDQPENTVVQHNYHDHANDMPSDEAKSFNKFPMRLFALLEQAHHDQIDHIISWQPHGRCFAIHKPKELQAILSGRFKITKYKSFLRQCNMYGFLRLTQGQDKGCYYHELFLRGKPYLVKEITRIQIKGTGVRSKSNPDQEPDFYAMPWVSPESSSSSRSYISAEDDNKSKKVEQDTKNVKQEPFHSLETEPSLLVTPPNTTRVLVGITKSMVPEGFQFDLIHSIDTIKKMSHKAEHSLLPALGCFELPVIGGLDGQLSFGKVEYMKYVIADFLREESPGLSFDEFLMEEGW
jgi:hypothetical protein